MFKIQKLLDKILAEKITEKEENDLIKMKLKVAQTEAKNFNAGLIQYLQT